MSARALRAKMFFKGGERKRVRAHFLSRPMRRAGCPVSQVREIGSLITRKMKQAVWPQSAMHCVQEGIRHDAPILMTPLRPGIGKEQMDRGDRLRRDEVADRVGTFEAQNTRVVQPALPDPRANPAYPAKQTFDTEKIPVRITCRHFGEKSSVATAQIDFNRAIASKDVAPRKRREKILRDEFSRRCRRRKRSRLAHPREVTARNALGKAETLQ